MKLKSETSISRYRQKMTWKSFTGRFGGFAYTNSLFIQLDAVVIKFTISKNKLLKLCNYRDNVRYPGVKTFNKTSP